MFQDSAIVRNALWCLRIPLPLLFSSMPLYIVLYHWLRRMYDMYIYYTTMYTMIYNCLWLQDIASSTTATAGVFGNPLPCPLTFTNRRNLSSIIQLRKLWERWVAGAHSSGTRSSFYTRSTSSTQHEYSIVLYFIPHSSLLFELAKWISAWYSGMMKERNITATAMPASRIHTCIPNGKTSKSSSAYLSFKAQPPRPRPPCWQDFIGKKLSCEGKLNSTVSVSASASSDSNKKHKGQGHYTKHKKSSNSKSKGQSSSSSLSSQTKLKRTRSEPCIAEKEIPAEAAQARLTSQQLSKQSMDEAKRYLEDAYHKCSQWLAQISPGTCVPLEDTDFQVGSGDILALEDETRKDIDYHAKRHSLALDKIPE